MILIFISLITKDVEYSFMRPLAICSSSLGKYLSDPLLIFNSYLLFIIEF